MLYKLNVAIYQGFPFFHYEMIPFAVDYCISKGYEFTVYVHVNAISYAYNIAYDSFFGRTLSWKDINTFRPDNHDVILLLTDDDRTIHHTDESIRKTICIDHFYVVRDNHPYPVRINTRMFMNRHIDPYIRCLSKGIGLHEKKQILRQHEKIHIVSVGGGTYAHHPKVLDMIFGKDHGNHIEFHFIDRSFSLYPTVQEDFASYNNVHFYQNIPPQEIFKILENSTYMLCNNIWEPHVHRICSGCISMAYTFCCRLLVSDSWKSAYGFQSAVSFGEGCPKDSYKRIDIKDPMLLELADVDVERTVLLTHRDQVLDEAIGNVILAQHEQNLVA